MQVNNNIYGTSQLTWGDICELSVAQLVGFLVVEHAYPGLSLRLDMGARIFLDYSMILRRYSFSGRRRARRQRNASGDCQSRDLSVQLDYSEVRDAHRGRVCVRAFIGVSVRSCMSVCVCNPVSKKILCVGCSGKSK